VGNDFAHRPRASKLKQQSPQRSRPARNATRITIVRDAESRASFGVERGGCGGAPDGGGDGRQRPDVGSGGKKHGGGTETRHAGTM
jgi:hypothetical protein